MNATAKHEFWVVTGQHEAKLLFSGDGERAAVVFGEHQLEVSGPEAGPALWATMRRAGVTANDVNGFDIHLADAEERLRIATLRPVLEGARVVWWVLYRADHEAKAFRSVGTRQRVGDAFAACFEPLRADLKRPHKP